MVNLIVPIFRIVSFPCMGLKKGSGIMPIAAMGPKANEQIKSATFPTDLPAELTPSACTRFRCRAAGQKILYFLFVLCDHLGGGRHKKLPIAL